MLARSFFWAKNWRRQLCRVKVLTDLATSRLISFVMRVLATGSTTTPAKTSKRTWTSTLPASCLAEAPCWDLQLGSARCSSKVAAMSKSLFRAATMSGASLAAPAPPRRRTSSAEAFSAEEAELPPPPAGGFGSARCTSSERTVTKSRARTAASSFAVAFDKLTLPSLSVAGHSGGAVAASVVGARAAGEGQGGEESADEKAGMASSDAAGAGGGGGCFVATDVVGVVTATSAFWTGACRSTEKFRGVQQ
mmetsp:Transcript_146448/g.380730  ORF Transcript_146448/g.380730 Transcript_146448/m.380730 type:complete len:250 (-) Transcript_146448:1156-1905(-)